MDSRTVRLAAMVLLWALTLPGCGSSTDALEATDPPPGRDVTDPFPIDRGDDGSDTPGTYKGLLLRLTDNGEPNVSAEGGVIGVVCVGMSNSSQECAEYLARLEGEWAGAVASGVRAVNCARGGHAIEKWIDPAFDEDLWRRCVERLPQSGLQVDQVRVIYHKAANQFTTVSGGAAKPPYPASGSDYAAFYDNLGAFAARVTEWFPAAQAVYTTSRSYGGFARNPGRGEPLSYEEGHALNRWLEEHPAVDGVWYGWGPYIWAGACDGGEANGSGVCYMRSDYVEDGVHPSESGRRKISDLIHARFRGHAWYRR